MGCTLFVEMENIGLIWSVLGIEIRRGDATGVLGVDVKKE